MVNFEFRTLSLSGAETGGGTTAGFIVCTGADENWRLTAAGAGGTTFAERAGGGRKGSRLRFSAGGATEGSRFGAASGRSRDTVGAGGTTAGASFGATSVWSLETFGAGGTTVVLRFGAVMG